MLIYLQDGSTHGLNGIFYRADLCTNCYKKKFINFIREMYKGIDLVITYDKRAKSTMK